MTFREFIGSGNSGIIGVLNGAVVPVIFALALLMFIWGVVRYFFLNSGSDELRTEGKQFVVWGIVGMVVMFSVWGILNILLSTLGIKP